jgi:hypothetical protein
MSDDHQSGSRLPAEYFHTPVSARIWNYWMGGKDNYPVDRAAGDAWAAVHPEIVDMARQSRQFLIRVVRFLAAEAGIRQFLDIGTGLPTMQNTHEVAQSVAPKAKVVYVDNDPLVLAHARALLTSTTAEGTTAYLDADVRQAELIVDRATELLDLSQPVAVLFMGILGHIDDPAEACSIVARVVRRLPSGSYLSINDGADTDHAAGKASASYAETGAVAYHFRSLAQLRANFQGLELLPPGLVPIARWRPDPAEIGVATPVAAYGAVARTP